MSRLSVIERPLLINRSVAPFAGKERGIRMDQCRHATPQLAGLAAVGPPENSRLDQAVKAGTINGAFGSL